MEAFRKCFYTFRPAIIAMIHVNALPGTPQSKLSVKDIIHQARKQAQIYKACGVHSVMVENMHDVPYMIRDSVGPEITSAMTAICGEVKEVFGGPVGIQILAAANKQALAVAQAADLQFVRVEGFVYSHVADEGLLNACAGDLLRYRWSIGATSILLFTDIKKKHCAHQITADISIEEMAQAAEMFLSDGVIITGSSTGQAACTDQLARVQQSTRIPVFVGSGITADNSHEYLTADALIVGSHFKRDGKWWNNIDEAAVTRFMAKLDSLQSANG